MDFKLENVLVSLHFLKPMGLGSIIFKEWRVTRTFSYTYSPSYLAHRCRWKSEINNVSNWVNRSCCFCLFVFPFVFGGAGKGDYFCFVLGWYIFYILWFLYLYSVCWTSCFNSIKIKKKMYLLFFIFIIFCIHLNNNLQHCTNMYNNNTINILKKN